MHIPLSYADAVIGTGGANISYIRRASGATVTIQESWDFPGQMTVEIIGSATQVQTARQLIQVQFFHLQCHAYVLHFTEFQIYLNRFALDNCIIDKQSFLFIHSLLYYWQK